MTRLPQPGQDKGTWGNILNDFLAQSHNSDGSLKSIPSTKVTGLAPVASTGSYADLSNKPTIPTQASDIGAITASAVDSKIAAQAAADAGQYATKASPSFTGTVSGVTKTMVGLGNVDNTADLDKPVSAAQQAAIAAVAPVSLLTLSRPSALAVSAGSAKLPLPRSGQIKSISLALGTAANQDVIVDCNINGTSVFTDAGQRPRVPSGQLLSSKTNVSVNAAAGQYLTIDIDQVGGPSLIQHVATTVSATYNQTPNVTRPLSAAIGDVHIAAIMTTVGGTVGSTTEPTTIVTTPTGWTRIGSGPVRTGHYAGARDLELHLFWWRDDGTQQEFDFTVTQPYNNAYARTHVVTLRGCSTSPIDAFSFASPARAYTGQIAPSVTTTVPNALVVGIFALDGTPSGAVSVSGMTITGPNPIDLITAIEQRTTAGATGGRTLSGPGTPTGTMSVTALISVAPDTTGALPGTDLTAVIEYQG